MPGIIQQRLSLKIALPLIGILALLMTIFAVVLIKQQTQTLETLIFTKGRSLALIGVRAMEETMESALRNGDLSEADLFDTDYQRIKEGFLAKAQIPKYHTRYDSYLDNAILGTLDSFVEEDPSVIFAVLVDSNGYLPTHNSRYSKPLSGDPATDRDNNRTKRIFDDPVGLAAARFEGTPEQSVLRQIYRRDTGETMWDIAAPVHVRSRHWGAFRIGLSMTATEQAIRQLRLTVGLSMLTLLVAASLTVLLVIKRNLRPLERVTTSVKRIAAGHREELLELSSDDEIGALVAAFNTMTTRLQQTTVSRDYVDGIVESMHDALLTVSRTGIILSANQAACTLLGYRKDELVDRPVSLILSGDSDGKPTMTFKLERFCTPLSITASGQRCPLLVAKDGSKVPVSLSSSPLLDEAGTVQSLVWVAQDISKRRRMELSLKNALEKARRLAISLEEQQATLAASHAELTKTHAELQSSQSIILQQEKLASIGQLAAGVAHEVNNPIGFISSNLNSLAKYLEKLAIFMEAQNRVNSSLPDGPGQEEVAALRKKLKLDFLLQDSQDLIKESLEGTERVRKIVQGLKTFSRTDQEKQGMADLNACLESTINLVWNELKYKATLHRDYGELPPTRCYPQKLSQVFMNLLVNASQAIEKQGEISIKTRYADGRIRIWIADTGCGIPPQNLQKIFDPFFTTKEVGKGTGLGMSIASEIIKQHNGTITVSSEIGKGTTFAIDLPRIEE